MSDSRVFFTNERPRTESGLDPPAVGDHELDRACAEDRVSPLPAEVELPAQREPLARIEPPPLSSPHNQQHPQSNLQQQQQLEKMLLAQERRDILKVNFNQECNMFSCATESGLLLYNLDPLLLKSRLGALKSGSELSVKSGKLDDCIDWRSIVSPDFQSSPTWAVWAPPRCCTGPT